MPYFLNTSYASRLLVRGSSAFLNRLMKRCFDLIKDASNYTPLLYVYHVGTDALTNEPYYRLLHPRYAKETCEYVSEFTQSDNFWGLVLLMEDLAWAGEYLDVLLNARKDSRVSLIGAFEDEALAQRLGKLACVQCGSRLIFSEFEIETGLGGEE